MDFMGAPDESRLRINDWVAEETEGKVKDLLAPGVIGALHPPGAHQRHLFQRLVALAVQPE